MDDFPPFDDPGDLESLIGPAFDADMLNEDSNQAPPAVTTMSPWQASLDPPSKKRALGNGARPSGKQLRHKATIKDLLFRLARAVEGISACDEASTSSSLVALAPAMQHPVGDKQLLFENLLEQQDESKTFVTDNTSDCSSKESTASSVAMRNAKRLPSRIGKFPNGRSLANL